MSSYLAPCGVLSEPFPTMCLTSANTTRLDASLEYTDTLVLVPAMHSHPELQLGKLIMAGWLKKGRPEYDITAGHGQ